MSTDKLVASPLPEAVREQEQAGGLNPDYSGPLDAGDLREWLCEIRDNPASGVRSQNSAVTLLELVNYHEDGRWRNAEAAAQQEREDFKRYDEKIRGYMEQARIHRIRREEAEAALAAYMASHPPPTPLKVHRFDCATCGQGIAVDEDGCCRSCGADAVAYPPPTPEGK